MDPQLVENLDEQVPQNDPFPVPWSPMKIGILHGTNVVQGTVISRTKSVTNSPAYLLVGVAGHVSHPPHEQRVVVIIPSTQAGFDVV